MNDQRARAALCAQIAALGGIRAVVETGTYRATTTLFLASTFACPVHSVEIDPRLHFYARLRTRGVRDVHLALGDTRDFLRRPDLPRGDVFYYLDAHRAGDDPLRDELALIAAAAEEPVVMIDDFEVPGDPGYRHNDGLDARILPADLRAFYPSTPSSQETGHRRGCVVLARPGRWSDRLAGLYMLRPPSTSMVRPLK